MKKIEPPVVPSLIDVQLAFEHWRNTRSGRCSTPPHLRVLAIGLLELHRQSTVCEALGVNSVALKRWTGKSKIDTVGSSQFITLSMRDESVANPEQCQIMIHLPNGVQVSTQGSYDLIQLLSAASTLSVST